MQPRLFHRWSAAEGMMLRMVLGAKGITYESIESLANDRYDAYAQLERRGRLREVARRLAQQGFYGATLSLVDIVLTADLHLLHLLDGVTIPLDLLYYFQRVATACGVSLEDGMAHHL